MFAKTKRAGLCALIFSNKILIKKRITQQKGNTMNNIKNLIRLTVVKAAQAALVTAFIFVAVVPAHAQTADVRYAGVFYKDYPQSTREMYCDYLRPDATMRRAGLQENADLLDSIARYATIDVYTDGDLSVTPLNAGGGSIVFRCGSQRQAGTHYDLGDRYWINSPTDCYQVIAPAAGGNTDSSSSWTPSSPTQTTVIAGMSTSIVDGELSLTSAGSNCSFSARVPGGEYATDGGGYYLETTNATYPYYSKKYCFKVTAAAAGYSISVGEGDVSNRSFVFTPQPQSASHQNDPWVSSALIEYDQPYPGSNPSLITSNDYPNHCLALCMNVTCTNKPIGGSTYSIAFPLQQIRFDVVKYYNGKNVENPEETPALRTIDLYPNQESAKCGSYHCAGALNGTPCSSAEYVCTKDPCKDWDTFMSNKNTCKEWETSSICKKLSGGSSIVPTNEVCGKYGENCVVFNNDGTETNADIPFCAAWDGSYEIAGEFGKTNGDFAFRATVKTDVPGDNIITDKISFDSTIAYPGMNQIPIQVDVTNIHTVRSTPTLVGNITAVSAQPYTYAYRLSKDADVRIAVFDASNLDAAVYASTVAATSNTSTPIGDEDNDYNKLIVRTIADWQPRLGEGMKGQEKDVQISEFDSWDGRDTSGMLLPAGNYLVSLQAKTADEWRGIDFSRAVTRQLSLDPLKLTDVVATGLTKQSTAYASIAYTPTESSKVYWNIYTPGTTFNNVLTDSSAQTGTAPVPTGGSLVYSLIEDRVGRMHFTSKWDGTCQPGGLTLQGPLTFQCGLVGDGCDGDTYPAGALNANGASMSGQGCVYSPGSCTPVTYYKQKGDNVNVCTRTYAEGERKSDGMIASAGDVETFQAGQPMPDGNYVYVLWAEIPYNGKYVNAVGSGTTPPAPKFTPNVICSGTGTEIDKQCFTGVKTLKYNVGEVAVERGVVDVTIQPVSYSTVGSSPTAYGLDPFIFKYSIARDATVVAKVANTAGVAVKYLTPQDGITQVAQQMNTISWDGRDDAGRMVTPGTYMFVVETEDAMFPAITNRASAVFPVDMYRVVDLATTDVYGDSEAKATISYALSKAMNTQVNIYNKDVVIPGYNTTTGAYSGEEIVTNTVTTTGYTGVLNNNLVIDTSATTTYPVPITGPSLSLGTITQTVAGTPNHRYTVTVRVNPNYVANSTQWDQQQYKVTVLDETLGAAGTLGVWPPRVCNVQTDGPSGNQFITAGGYVDPAKKPTCIYVNDTSFINYPANATAAVSVRLQPIKTFERSSMHPGDGLTITEEWDALYFNNPSKCDPASTDMSQCPYEMLPDGQYPFYVSARSNEPFDRYYYQTKDGNMTDPVTQNPYLDGTPFRTPDEIKQEPYLYATDKVTSKINVTRGAVYFLDGSTVVYPNAPQLFNVSSGPVFVPPYEINFSVSRAATVDVDIVALQAGVCNPDPEIHQDLKQNVAGDVCKSLATMTIPNTGHFDANIVRKMYWDGTDNNGFYVKPGIYEVRLTAKNYPNPNLYQPTVKSITLNADLLKVFDLLEADGYAISARGTNMKIGYQVSVPMKVALQILKPGTTIYDYQKGTLRNPTTGTEVKDIHEVLVKSIVGIRPATTLIEEIWDGTDYAGQEVPDGTYPFRFVTATNSADIDSVTGEIVGEWAQTDGQSANPALWKINKVADAYEYQNLHKATIAIGDGLFVCEDWEKTVFFYPNPFNETNGTLEITKMPVPGEVSIKFFNLAGDLVREGGYTCVDANNYQTVMGNSLKFQPDNDPVGSTKMTAADLANFENIRNAALRCRWDKTNQHGKKVARGVYFGLVDFKAQMGREHCQKVVKVLIP